MRCLVVEDDADIRIDLVRGLEAAGFVVDGVADGETIQRLRALALTPGQVMQLTPERVAMLPQDARCNSWRLGTDAALPLAGAQIATPAFDELQTSTPARMALWQQICAHEHDFYPQPG